MFLRFIVESKFQNGPKKLVKKLKILKILCNILENAFLSKFFFELEFLDIFLSI